MRYFLSKIESSEGSAGKWCSAIFNPCQRLQLSQAYSEPCQTSTIGHFVKEVKDWKIPTFKKLTQDYPFSQKALSLTFGRVLSDDATDFTTKTSFNHG